MKKNIRKNVLIVEDETPLLEAIKKKLEINDFSTISARSVEQAMNYLNDGVEIDAIWLDHYLLGKKTGLDFVAKIKEDNSKWKHIPVFLVSNTASSDKKIAYLQLGINKYYTKAEYPLDKIIQEIKNFFESGGQTIKKYFDSEL